MRKKRSINPYANIDWVKAEIMFKQSIVYDSGGKLYPKVKEILQILAAAGAVGITFLSPKAGTAIGRIILKDSKYSNWRMNQITRQLIKQKYVTIKENDDGTTTVKITKNGMIRALTYKIETMKLKSPKRWDKKWRVVIFDIPEKYKKVRDIFRMRLRQLNLYQLQESVYVSPYPCFDEIDFLRELYGVPFKVKYLLVEKIEDDSFLKNYFELPK